ncbi:hypothetical protein JCM11251_000926 [Rhodosporidiobolus azoricus]
MALFPSLSLRRNRSRPDMRSQRVSSSPASPPKPVFPSSPPPPRPPRPDSAHSIPVPPPPSPSRLRREASAIGYESLNEVSEPESSVEDSAEEGQAGEGGGKMSFARAVEGILAVEPEKVVLHRRATKRRSLPAHTPAPAAVFPQQDVPLPLSSPDDGMVERFSSPRSNEKGKRRISGSSLSSISGLTSPSLSPASSLRSPPTSVSSHSPSSASASTSSLSLNLVISTTIDQTSGRRVLVSRRSRQQSGDSASFGGNGAGAETPTRCKRTKGSYGVGDDEVQEEEDVFGGVEKASINLAGHFPPHPSLVTGGVGLGLIDGAMAMMDDELLDDEGETSRETLHPDFGGDFATPTSTPPASVRRARPPLAPLQPVSFQPSQPFQPVSASPTSYRRPPLPRPVDVPPPVQVPQYKPIQLFYPPPPLYPPSPTKTGALSSLTRAYSAYSSSSSAGDSPTKSSKRRNSLQPRKSLSKRLSLGGGLNGGSDARGGASFAPPMTPSSSASFSSSAHSRRFSAPVSPLTPLSRAPSTSTSGYCDPSTPSSPSFSTTPTALTPPCESGESTMPLVGSGGGSGGGMSASFSLSSLGDTSFSEAGHAPLATRRASVVSFELPPSSTLARRKTQLHPSSSHKPPSSSGSAGHQSGGGRRGHRRAASDADAILRAGGGGGGWVWGGTEVVRERLFVRLPPFRPSTLLLFMSRVLWLMTLAAENVQIANPDLPPIPSASLSTSPSTSTSVELSLDSPSAPPVPPLPSSFPANPIHRHQHHQERVATPVIGIAC